jgi:hypothetical protein
MTGANYLSKALVMYDSLQNTCGDDFKLIYFAFDSKTVEILNLLKYKNIIPVSIEQVEAKEPRLKSLKGSRSVAEYFFTCTAQAIEYALAEFEIDMVTYLDADLFFYKSPRVVIDEMGDNSILITDHRYYPPINNHKSGKYCVQFMPFRNDATSKIVLENWREQCIEWCFAYPEDGKYGDQGYLNDWTEKYENIVVSENRGVGIATWNKPGYRIYAEGNILKAYSEEIKKEIDVVFYHFNSLKIFSNRLISTGISKKDKSLYKLVYEDYLNRLSIKEYEILKVSGSTRKELFYPEWEDSILIFILKEFRRLLFPRGRDVIYFYKFLRDYIWLP